ncbi:MAG: DNA cytosine methyltransferase, partial [Proteobacteria bacterium]|nr:DNA cytosine methyltransferase [Pseudomonadota bacterium]
MEPFLGVDLFCGAGGTSTALVEAGEEAGVDVQLTAINHWDKAIETHTLNHPRVRHLCENLDDVNPRKLYPGGRLNLLMASPECTHHSNARGGTPCSDQSRATAWRIVD